MSKRNKKILVGGFSFAFIFILLFLLFIIYRFDITLPSESHVVDQYYQVLQSYYTENRKYPSYNEFSSFEETTDEGFLASYPNSVRRNDLNEYRGMRFYYFVDNPSDPQAFILCTSFADDNEIKNQELGGYCNGNGFGLDLGFSDEATIDWKLVPAKESVPGVKDDFYNLIHLNKDQGISGVWDGKEWSN